MAFARSQSPTARTSCLRSCRTMRSKQLPHEPSPYWRPWFAEIDARNQTGASLNYQQRMLDMAKKAANVKTEANGEADALEQKLTGKADKPGAPAELQLNLPCRFGSGGLPDGKCGLGVAFEIEHLTVAKAHALLVHRELSVRLLGGKAADEDPRQTSFVPDEDMPEIYATGTCKGMSANHKWVKIRLTFRDSDVDVETLKAIRARRGRFILEFSSAIPVPEKKAPKQGKRARVAS